MSPTGVTLVIMGVAGVVLAVSATGTVLNRRRGPSPVVVQPLDDLRRRAFATQWRSTQERFLAAPRQAVHDADGLVAEVLKARGYSADPSSLGRLPGAHAQFGGRYRVAHEVSVRNDRGTASPQELRTAMRHFRTLFLDLIEPDRERRNTDAG